MRFSIKTILLVWAVFSPFRESTAQSFYSQNLHLSPKTILLGHVNFSKNSNSNFEILANAALIDTNKNSDITFAAKSIGITKAFASAYGFNLKKHRIIVGLASVPFGSINGYDASGVATNTFNPNLASFNLASAHQIGAFTFGLSSNLSLANIQSYRYVASTINLSGLYVNNQQNFTVGWNINQVPIFIKSFGISHTIQPNIIVGGSLSPRYVPLRIHLSLFDILAKNYKKNFNLGIEILPSKPFSVLCGFDNAAINKVRIGIMIKKSNFVLTTGTELGPINSQVLSISYSIKNHKSN